MATQCPLLPFIPDLVAVTFVCTLFAVSHPQVGPARRETKKTKKTKKATATKFG